MNFGYEQLFITLAGLINAGQRRAYIKKKTGYVIEPIFYLL